MSTQSVNILCGRCKVAVNKVTEANRKQFAACPRCGRRDTVENALREASKQVEEVTARHLSESMRRAARGSKIIKVTHKPIQKRTYRFISDLRL